MPIQKALIGAGCFWGIEEYYKKLNGVEKTKVGYSGGNSINPTYEEVCFGNTGHAEVVLIDFDHEIIKYSKILEHFWKCHDPTQLNRQGYDIGTQYRSVIFYFDENQKKIALDSFKQIQNKTNKKIVTEISAANEFYLAEEYHQCYLEKRS
jgi:methionine-S-sulfoxide reductase|tara:strand:- start:2727 stop:3179 length:453 start_codon:yes stop_codon:yes gene_type:complete